MTSFYRDVLVPAIASAGWIPTTLDYSLSYPPFHVASKQLLNADLVIADMTEFSPANLIEIGCAMGAGKELILTAHQRAEIFRSKWPPILAGFNVLYWTQNSPEFRDELVRLLKSRPETGSRSPHSRQALDHWVQTHRATALKGLTNAGKTGFMEATFSLLGATIQKKQSELVAAADKAAIHAFGWPIGVVLHTDSGKPRPTTDGVKAEIHGVENSFDYWAISKTGNYYFLGSLFEDERARNVVWFDTRIMRVTETFLFCYRLYRSLGVPPETHVQITIQHGGLKGRTLSSARPGMWGPNRVAAEDKAEADVIVRLADIEERITKLVGEVLEPVFVLFDFYEPPRNRIQAHVDEFLQNVAKEPELKF